MGNQGMYRKFQEHRLPWLTMGRPSNILQISLLMKSAASGNGTAFLPPPGEDDTRRGPHPLLPLDMAFPMAPRPATFWALNAEQDQSRRRTAPRDSVLTANPPQLTNCKRP